MNIICKLTDKDFGINEIEMNEPKIRLASRGIVLNKQGKIALQNKTRKNEFKLIGGGMESREEPKEAFKREVLEETGCEIEIIEELGITEEYRSQKNFKQTSYVFVSKVINDTHRLGLTEKEENEGAKLLWVEPKEALELIINCYDKLLPSKYNNLYETRFVVLRDRKILEYYLEKRR